MMNATKIIAIVTAIVGVAMLTTLVRGSQTPQVIRAFGQGFSDFLRAFRV